MPPRNDYAAINISVSGITCARARAVLLPWLKRIPRYKRNKRTKFPATSGGWTFDGTLDDRSDATRGVASVSFKVILTVFART
jgi:hypothetical protein